MWFLTTGTPGGTDLFDLATDLYGTFETNILGHLSSQATLTECRVRYWDGSAFLAASSFASHTGGGDSHISPAQVAMVLSWSIDRSYRGGKPRSYLPYFPDREIDTDSAWSATVVASVATDAAAWLGDMQGLAPGGIDTVTPGCMHFFSGGAALAPPIFDPFLAVGVQKRICTQRRRLGRLIS
jgi:hypothetical protein